MTTHDVRPPVDGRDIFGSHEIAFECLADLDRTGAFDRAIAAAVRPGDRVLELGTGTGILSLMAARAGAASVDAYELSGPTAAMARRNIGANGYAEVVRVIEDDVTSCDFLGGPYDVVIAELVTVALLEELLVPAFNHLVARADLAPDVRLLPGAQSTWVELVDADDELFGFRFDMVQIEQTWQPNRVRHRAAPPVLVSRPDFEAAARAGRPVDPDVIALLDLEVVRDITVNALRLSSVSHLQPGIDSGWTQCMNSPALVPVPRRRLVAGQRVGAALSMSMGAGMSSVRFAWTDQGG